MQIRSVASDLQAPGVDGYHAAVRSGWPTRAQPDLDARIATMAPNAAARVNAPVGARRAGYARQAGGMATVSGRGHPVSARQVGKRFAGACGMPRPESCRRKRLLRASARVKSSTAPSPQASHASGPHRERWEPRSRYWTARLPYITYMGGCRRLSPLARWTLRA